jgi:hypothetical protein
MVYILDTINNYTNSIQCTGDIPILMYRFWYFKHKNTHSLPSQSQQATDGILKAWWGSLVPDFQLLNSVLFIDFENLSLALVGLGGIWKSTLHIPQYFLAPLQISTDQLQRWNIHGCYLVTTIRQGPSFWTCVVREQNTRINCSLNYTTAWSTF